VGSSRSKPRKGRKPRHLPKVGSPANRRWEHETHSAVEFGTPVAAIIIGAVLFVVVVGLLVLTL
jgi:hypothetical protein